VGTSASNWGGDTCGQVDMKVIGAISLSKIFSELPDKNGKGIS
jgi:hypothetical protein